jgi:AcrR family transcriptional regulator
MTTVDIADLGLRERKRLATRRAIQVAVLDLVSERGLAGVTVDEISRVADVSPRTFFNYFASKEEALLGDQPELPSEELIAAFVADTERSILDGLSEIMVGTSQLTSEDTEMAQRRQRLLKQYPELFAMRMATMRRFEDDVSEIVARRLVAEDPTLDAASSVVRDRARLVALVAFAAVRHAWTCWTAGEGSRLPDRLTESFHELKALFASGVA